jgi:lysophospholipase L1-like esterase
MRLRLALAAAFAALAATGAAHAAYPSSIASTGDSITRAFNDCSFPFVDCPAASWSTGTAGYSHYSRLRAVNPAITGRSWNHAVSGADMADLQGQVAGVVGRGAEYVTVLMGANDVCASSEAGMTPVDVFSSQFAAAMTTLTGGLPNARVFVSSIPDVHQLFQLYRFNLGANAVWAIAGICQSMLANPWSSSAVDTQRRARVRQRNIDYNTVLGQVCATFTNCRFDNNAVFNTGFARSDVSTRDYFHPSVAGQSKLAGVTWSAAAGFLS